MFCCRIWFLAFFLVQPPILIAQNFDDFVLEQAYQGIVLSPVQINQEPGSYMKMAAQAVEELDAKAQALLEIPVENLTFENFVEPLDVMMVEVDRIIVQLSWPTYFLVGGEASEEAEHAFVLLMRWFNAWTLNSEVLKRIRLFKDKRFSSERKRLVAVLTEYFEWASNKPSSLIENAELLGVLDQLEQFSLKLIRNVSEHEEVVAFTEHELRGVDKAILNKFPRDGQKFLVNLSEWWQNDSLLRMASSRQTRKRAFEAWISRGGKQNRDLAQGMVTLRQHLARRLKFKSWTAHQIHGLSPKNVRSLSQSVSQLSLATADAFEQEKKLMRTRLRGKDPEPWDVSFVQDQLRQEILGISDSELRQYFPVENVRLGLFQMAETFLQIKIEKLNRVPGKWHRSVDVYSVRDARTGKVKGLLYLDLFPRKEKDPWFFVIQNGFSHVLDGKSIRPSSVVVCNFPPAGRGVPSLLNFEEVWTFAHELGHALHYLMVESSYGSLYPGESISDLIEFPSVLFERLVWEPSVLRRFAYHWRTGKRLSPEVLERIPETRNVLPAHMVRDRVAKSALDLNAHSSKRPNLHQVELGVMSKHYYPLPEGKSLVGSFTYLAGYDGLYWTYLWAEAMVQEIIEEIKSSGGGVLDPKIGSRIRRRFMEKGASQSSRDLINNTLGRPIDFCRSVLAYHDIVPSM